LIPEIITPKEQCQLVELINNQQWDKTLARRTQQYGYKYQYRNLNASPRASPAAPIPSWLAALGSRVSDECSARGHNVVFDQVIVNEYEPDQGISKHVDDKVLFGPVVASVSMMSSCEMLFELGALSCPIVLDPRSCVILTGPSRERWSHAIWPRVARTGTRISITFRSMLV